jgi:hypothetical protein
MPGRHDHLCRHADRVPPFPVYQAALAEAGLPAGEGGHAALTAAQLAGQSGGALLVIHGAQ